MVERLIGVCTGHPEWRKTPASLGLSAGNLVEFSRGPHAHKFWLKSVLFRNTSCMSLTFLTSHPEISWLTLVRKNNLYMDPTCPTFQLASPTPVKDVAPWNIRFMLVTRETSKCPTGWLNLLASWNICCMLVALDVFQFVRGSLKVVLD